MHRDSPTRRVRAMTDVGSRTAVFHVGLAHEKLAPHNTKADKDAQSRFIRNLVDHSDVPPAYAAAFRRWVRRTPAASGAQSGRRVAIAVSQGRVLCGLGELTPTENGLSIHTTYGVPFLPGASLKGITKAWLKASSAGGMWAPEGRAFRDVFGVPADEDETGGMQGAVAFYDALWIPGESDLPAKPWAAEIVTPHFGAYYAEGSTPDGTQSPVPVTFLAAQGGFRVVLEGPDFLLDAVLDAVGHALLERGIGAKSRAGYGRLRIEPGRETLVDQQLREARLDAEREQQRHREYSGAITIAAMLDVIAKHEPEVDLRAAVAAWLTEADHAHSNLRSFPVNPDTAAAAYAWAHENDLAKGLRKRVEGRVPESILQALAGNNTQRGRFGSNHLAELPPPPSSKRQKKRWPNSFSMRIAEGGFDEDTVRRALAHLRAHGGKPGHVKNILDAYGLDDEA